MIARIGRMVRAKSRRIKTAFFFFWGGGMVTRLLYSLRPFSSKWGEVQDTSLNPENAPTLAGPSVGEDWRTSHKYHSSSLCFNNGIIENFSLVFKVSFFKI